MLDRKSNKNTGEENIGLQKWNQIITKIITVEHLTILQETRVNMWKLNEHVFNTVLHIKNIPVNNKTYSRQQMIK